MLRELPSIVTVNVESQEIRYQWDDWIEQPLESLDEELHASIARLSNRSAAALALGSAEWVVARYSSLVDISLPCRWLESGWVQIADIAYRCARWEGDIPATDWPGPVRRPIWRVLKSTVSCLEDTDPALVWYATCMAIQMARYVLPAREPFNQWLDAVYKRLSRLYRLDPLDPVGDVVPREVLELSRPFDISATERLVNRYLAVAEASANPFLCSSSQMISDGFQGIPYHFDMSEDREHRMKDCL
jgi:hypothetical protein